MNRVTLRVNGLEVTKTVEPRMHLADFVREELNLTGTHLGCEHGVCGACTMIVDGRPIRSCISYAVTCAGSDVRTVESFDDDPVMGLLRNAFTRHHALQCGYCTPGMLATAYDIVTRLHDADEARVREELSGNLCRCTGYVGIVAAIREVLKSGPHRTAIRAIASSQVPVPDGLTRTLGPVATDTAQATIDRTVSLSEPTKGGITLTRSVSVSVPAEQLWATLQDIETIARCLPGAKIESVDPDGTIVGAFEVAIGPMRARFRGQARIAFNSEAWVGNVYGGGGDSATRSRADGAIHFSAQPVTPDCSRLDLAITYKLSGPLAQFGRPAVVEAVVDRLLAEATKNLAQAASGGIVADAAPISAIQFLFETLVATVRRFFQPNEK
jgi:aerobic carbon-monoxide dehydrogenase small subunit